MAKCEVQVRHEEGIERGSMQRIRARIGVISEAVCKAAVDYWRESMSNSRRQGMNQKPNVLMSNTA